MAERVEGLSKAVRHLQSLGAGVEDLKDVMANIASEGARTMARFVPVRSGALRSSVRGNRAKSKAVVAAGRASVAYAGAINYGWVARHITPARFIERTDEAMEPKALSMLSDGLDALIKKEGLE